MDSPPHHLPLPRRGGPRALPAKRPSGRDVSSSRRDPGGPLGRRPGGRRREGTGPSPAVGWVALIRVIAIFVLTAPRVGGVSAHDASLDLYAAVLPELRDAVAAATDDISTY